MNMQNFNWRITQKVIKIKVILLAILVLSPSLASAKMLKIGEDWINETAIIGLKQANGKEAGCSIIYSLANRFTTETVKGSCEDFIKEKEIDSK